MGSIHILGIYVMIPRSIICIIGRTGFGGLVIILIAHSFMAFMGRGMFMVMVIGKVIIIGRVWFPSAFHGQRGITSFSRMRRAVSTLASRGRWQ